MNQSIYILSRPLSNILDEGSKNLVYYLCLNTNHSLSVVTENSFELKLSPSVTTYKLDFEVDKENVENSRSLKVKIHLIKRLFQARKINTVHCFFTITPLNAFILLMVRFFYRVRVVVTIPAFPIAFENNFLIKRVMRKAECVVVMTNDTSKLIKRFTDKVQVIPPLVDDNKYFPMAESLILELKKKLGITAEFTVIIPGEYGRLDMNENSVKIVKETNKRHPEVLFIFSFRLKTGQDKIIENKIKKRLIGCSVLFLNTINNYHEYASIADISVFPANSMDGKFDLPLALVELMCSGVPVFHSDIPKLNELYKTQVDQFALRRNEVYVEKISQCFTQREAFKRYKEVTLREAVRFSPEKVTKQYDLIYNGANV
jgi:glycosyltransferase involved in cell wall biosynthesis